MPLGSLLWPSQAVLEGLEPKNIENLMFFKVFASGGFRYFDALDGHLGPILAPLGQIWSKMGPKNSPKSGPNSAQKLVKKRPQKLQKNISFRRKIDPKMAQDGEIGAQASQDGGF